MTLVSDDTSRPYAVPTPSGARRGLKASAGRHQGTTPVSPVKWAINERYGLGRDQYNFIVYRARTPKPDKPGPKIDQPKPVAYFLTLEGAMMWIVMRQAHFDDDPTIDTDILDAFQRYSRCIDRTKADIRALAERLETTLPSDAPYRSLAADDVWGTANSPTTRRLPLQP